MSFDLSGIIVLTGLPGAGKTLYMMQVAERAVAEGRPVFQCGINGMSLPGVQVWEDPHAWKDLPPRAVLLVDEAQDHFRTRPGSVAAPKSITDMERIRHSGVCMVLTTQQPTYLDKHLRGLAQHHHLVEVLAGRTSNVYRFRSVREDVTPHSLTDAELQLWTHPRHLYPFYKSAEVHTKKFRLPFRILVLCGGTCLVVLGLAYAFWPSSGSAAVTGEARAPKGLGLAEPAPAPTDAAPMTATDYAKRFVPRFATMPQSAPAYDERPVVAEPRIVCMSSRDGMAADGWKDASVTCLTEQGTVYDLGPGEARRVARYGPVYDPFKRPEAADSVGNAGMRPPSTTRRAGASSGGWTLDAPQVTGYGALAK
ncbi:zonular occludens toxin domain-containing protein [Lysobacter sp. D1-1-M9]|uniref:zonular occludens toxin domain-containing protein n=2 Tax=Novilysobacter TaxID=3382699 RepID=UPI002FCA7947